MQPLKETKLRQRMLTYCRVRVFEWVPGHSVVVSE